VECVAALHHLEDADVAGQPRVERRCELRHGQRVVETAAGHLPERMHPGVGASGPDDGDRPAFDG